MPQRLTADASDLASTFALYDPGALAGVSLDGRDLSTGRALAERGIAVHHAGEGNPSFDNPGTERRVAYLYADEPFSEEHAARAVRKVASSRLSVPTGRLYFASLDAMSAEGTPARRGEAFGEAEVPAGDYHLEIWFVDWAPGEQVRFIDARVEPSDAGAEHRVGCLGFFTLASTVVVPIALLVTYLLVPWASGTPSPWYAAGAVVALGLLWFGLFAASRAPSQRRMIAARHAVQALNLPSPIYRISREPPGSDPAFVDETLEA